MPPEGVMFARQDPEYYSFVSGGNSNAVQQKDQNRPLFCKKTGVISENPTSSRMPFGIRILPSGR